MIISRTPLRVSFVGGGTDIKNFYTKFNYGSVISTSIQSYIYVILKSQSDIFKEKYRLNYSITERVKNIHNIKNPIIRECLKYMGINERLYMATISDVPAATGLGSSSAFCVGLLNALYKYKYNKNISQERLAKEAAHIETNILKRPMGKQDHYGSAIGGLKKIIFYDDESVKVKKINLNKKQINNFENSIQMFWTGFTRASESVLKNQVKNNLKNSKFLIDIRNFCNDFERNISKNNIDIKLNGKILNDSWALKKKLSNNISNTLIDKIYTKAIQSGAHGGKILGAGNGGFLMFFVDKKNKTKLKNSLKKLKVNSFTFKIDNSGAKVYKIIE